MMYEKIRIKKNKAFWCCLLVLTISFFVAKANDSFDQFADFDVDLDSMDAFDKASPRRDVKTQEDIDSDLILAMTSIEKVVTGSIWNNTRGPSGRDILYLLPYKISALERGGFAVNLFFNMTDNMNVGVKNLLNTEALALDELAELVTELPSGSLGAPLGEAELASLLALFKKITLQERKLGGMIQFGFIKGPFTVQLNTSLHMAERNFWLNPEDQESISAMIKSDGGNRFSEDELKRFRYGLGDTRLKFGLNTLNMTNLQTDFGCEAIIPTSRFSYSGRYKTTASQSIDSLESFSNDLFTVLRGVRDYLINPRMGNNGHFGLGFYMEAKANVFHNLANVWTRISYDKLLPAEEDCLLMHKKTLNDDALKQIENRLSATHFGTDEYNDLIKEFRQTSSDFTKEKLFPTVFRTTVYPGDVFNAVFAISSDIKKMRFTLGYDFYAQQAGRIRKIHNTNVTLDQLLVEDAQSLLAYQHKIFTEALYIKKYKRCDMGFGLGGDMTIASQGIGKDWTAYAKLTASF